MTTQDKKYPRRGSYCVWTIDVDANHVSVFRYNYAQRDGDEVARDMGRGYFCSKQERGPHGESCRPNFEDALAYMQNQP